MEVYEQDRMYLSLSLLGRGSLGWRTEDSLILPTPWQTRGKQFSLVSDYLDVLLGKLAWMNSHKLGS